MKELPEILDQFLSNINSIKQQRKFSHPELFSAQLKYFINEYGISALAIVYKL